MDEFVTCGRCGTVKRACAETVIVNLGYIGGRHHDVEIDGDPWRFEAEHEVTCFDCVKVVGRKFPKAKCVKCSSEHANVNEWDGAWIGEICCSAHRMANGGYGSTTFDDERAMFPGFAVGWHCYGCLDAAVRSGKGRVVERNYLGCLSPDPNDPSLGPPEGSLVKIRPCCGPGGVHEGHEDRCHLPPFGPLSSSIMSTTDYPHEHDHPRTDPELTIGLWEVVERDVGAGVFVRRLHDRKTALFDAGQLVVAAARASKFKDDPNDA